MLFLPDLAAEVTGILLVTVLVALVLIVSMSRLDSDPRSHPRRSRHLARH